MTKKKEQTVDETVVKEDAKTFEFVPKEGAKNFEDNASKENLVPNDQYLRLQADFENYKKRNSATAVKMYNEGVEDVLTDVLPLVDCLDLAIKSQAEDGLRKGIELIKKNFMDVLSKFSVEEIEAIGKDFDPNVHEAVMSKDDADNAGKVIEVFKKGYKHGAIILRHPMVVVGK